MGSAAIFSDRHDHFLVVKPNYKDHWSLPGGAVEKDESPKHACLREVKEEIGIELEAKLLLEKRMNDRIPKCLDAIKTGTAIYLENGGF